ncbi:DinB family protein [Exiguobacterium sp. UBA3491]|uniref:DinB family protein n=1 Tax=Exiguobacterium sp. UBA3491 TaxID=1946491 RepID=UPI0025BC2BEC|nr:DinB family protein [Exiguobacterium sp. UBA3491]
MNELFTYYLQELDRYHPEGLIHHLDHDTWSISQMYDHLIVVSHEYLDEVESCRFAPVTTSGKSPFGEQLFAVGAFPATPIRLPDAMNAPPNETDQVEQLRTRWLQLIDRHVTLATSAQSTPVDQKTQHGGMGWLNAAEWYALVSYHLAHHRNQKRRLDAALAK